MSFIKKRLNLFQRIIRSVNLGNTIFTTFKNQYAILYKSKKKYSDLLKREQ